MKKQIFIFGENILHQIDACFKNKGKIKVFLVCGSAYHFLDIRKYFDDLKPEVVYFNDFTPNPSYDSVSQGVKLFLEKKCNFIVMVGGGSAVDVGKCIKLFSNMQADKNYLEQEVRENNIPCLAIPTTAGAGSESTQYAVIYYNGEKQSIAHESILPDYVVLKPSLLKSLPDYQRKATMLDALCHAIESFWSVNSTEQSKSLSGEAIKLIVKNKNGYLNNYEGGNSGMLIASNIAGQAINFTQTTAGHAMSYKLTTIYHIAHGHAVALCLPIVWEYMLNNIERCIDIRGKEYLLSEFEKLAEIMECASPLEAVKKFKELFNSLNLEKPRLRNQKELQELVDSVNPTRLKNTPVIMDGMALKKMYVEILGE